MPFDNVHCGNHNGKHCRHPVFTEALRGVWVPESSCVPVREDVRETGLVVPSLWNKGSVTLKETLLAKNSHTEMSLESIPTQTVPG